MFILTHLFDGRINTMEDLSKARPDNPVGLCFNCEGDSLAMYHNRYPLLTPF